MDSGESEAPNGRRNLSQYRQFMSKAKAKKGGVNAQSFKTRKKKQVRNSHPDKSARTLQANGFSRAFTVGQGLTIAKGESEDKPLAAANSFSTSKILQFLVRLKNSDRITASEQDLLRNAVMAGDHHAVRVLRQMSRYGITSGADTLLSQLLAEITENFEGVAVAAVDDGDEGEGTTQPLGGNELAIVQGMLSKKRAFGMHVPRYFVLVDNELRYYGAKTGKRLENGDVAFTEVKIKGSYSHNKYTLVKDVAGHVAKCTFDLQVGEKKTLRLRAKNREEKQIWLTALAEWIVAGGKLAQQKNAVQWSRGKSYGKLPVSEEVKTMFSKPVSKKMTVIGSGLAKFKKRTSLWGMNKLDSSDIKIVGSERNKNSKFEAEVEGLVNTAHKGRTKAIFEGPVTYRMGETGSKTWEDMFLTMTESRIFIHKRGEEVFAEEEEEGRTAALDEKQRMRLGNLVATLQLTPDLKLKASTRKDFQFSLSSSKSVRNVRRGAFEFSAITGADYRSWVATMSCALKLMAQNAQKRKRASLVAVGDGWNAKEKRKSLVGFVVDEEGSNLEDRDSISSVSSMSSILSDGSRISSRSRTMTVGVRPGKGRPQQSSIKRSVMPLSSPIEEEEEEEGEEVPKRTISISNLTPSSLARHASDTSTTEGQCDVAQETVYSTRRRRHSVATLGTHRGQSVDFRRFLNSSRGRTLSQNTSINLNSTVAFETQVLAMPKAIKKKSSGQIKMLKKAVGALGSAASVSRVASALFKQLDDRAIDELVAEMVYIEVPANCTVMQQGKSGELFYVVEAGRFILEEEIDDSAIKLNVKTERQSSAALFSKKRVVVRSKRHSAIGVSTGSSNNSAAGAGPGDCFGHEALFYDVIRSATIKTLSTPGILWAMSKVQFQVVARKSAHRKKLLKRRIFQFVPLISKFLKHSEMKRLSSCSEDEVVEEGKVVLSNSLCKKMYIVLSGQALVSTTASGGGNTTTYTLTRGEVFGEDSLQRELENKLGDIGDSYTVSAKQGKLHLLTISLGDARDALDEERVSYFCRHLASPSQRLERKANSLKQKDGRNQRRASMMPGRGDAHPKPKKRDRSIKGKGSASLAAKRRVSMGNFDKSKPVSFDRQNRTGPQRRANLESSQKSNLRSRIRRQSRLGRVPEEGSPQKAPDSPKPGEGNSSLETVLPPPPPLVVSKPAKRENSTTVRTPDRKRRANFAPSDPNKIVDKVTRERFDSINSDIGSNRFSMVSITDSPESEDDQRLSFSTPRPLVDPKKGRRRPFSFSKLPVKKADLSLSPVGTLSPIKDDDVELVAPRRSVSLQKSSPKSSPKDSPKAGVKADFGPTVETTKKKKGLPSWPPKKKGLPSWPPKKNSLPQSKSKSSPPPAPVPPRLDTKPASPPSVSDESSPVASPKDTPSPNRERLESTYESDVSEEGSSSEDSEEDFEEYDLEWDKGKYLDPTIKLTDLTVHKTLGHGAFSKVKLVSGKGQFFALKCMERTYIAEEDCQDLVDNEISALRELNGRSKFLVGLYGAFATKKMIFLLQELCSGGELYEYLHGQDLERFPESTSVFYTCCIIEGLRVIHSRKIAYRDLKLENIIIDDVGYVKLVDFGLAKKTNRTYTQCGTPEYMAPEMVLSVGHSLTVDWWALGILMYEMATGTTPFVGADTMETYENILDYKSSIPLKYKNIVETDLSGAYRRVIQRFLRAKPSRRLGSKGVDDVVSCQMFTKFPWSHLREKSLEAPYVPGNNDEGVEEEDTAPLPDNAVSVVDDPDFLDAQKDSSGWNPRISQWRLDDVF